MCSTALADTTTTASSQARCLRRASELDTSSMATPAASVRPRAATCASGDNTFCTTRTRSASSGVSAETMFTTPSTSASAASPDGGRTRRSMRAHIRAG